MIDLDFIVGLLTYIVVTFFFAIVWNLVLFKRAYASLAGSIAREKPIIPLGLVAIIIQGIALVVLYSEFYKPDDTIADSLLLTYLTGLFIATFEALVNPAKFVIELVWKYTLLEAAYHVTPLGVIGVAFAFIFGT